MNDIYEKIYYRIYSNTLRIINFISELTRVCSELIFTIIMLLIAIVFLKRIVGNNLIIDITQYHVIIIISATLCLLVIGYSDLIEKNCILDKEKRKSIRISGGMLFEATINYSIFYFISLLFEITQEFSLGSIKITQDNQNKIISIIMILFGINATITLFGALLRIIRVGKPYESELSNDIKQEKIKRKPHRLFLKKNKKITSKQLQSPQ